MKTSPTLTHQTARVSRMLRMSAAALALGLAVLAPQVARADDNHFRGDDVVPPAVPANLEVPAGYTAFLVGHAAGTQDYICLPSGAGFAWTFFGPQATLFDDDDEQIITHFLSSNPFESGTPRPTWQQSRDTSVIWGKSIASSTDANFVATGAIPWLLLQVVGEQSGPTGGDRLTKTAYLQRLNTSGGVAPSSGCAVSTDVGRKALVPYTANYFFYQAEQTAHHNVRHGD